MEMTGLDMKKNPNNQTIEIAVIVTDGSLETSIEGPNLIIQCPDKVLDEMDDWCKNTHAKSGLT